MPNHNSVENEMQFVCQKLSDRKEFLRSKSFHQTGYFVRLEFLKFH